MPHLGYKFHDIQKNYLLMFAQKAASETSFVPDAKTFMLRQTDRRRKPLFRLEQLFFSAST